MLQIRSLGMAENQVSRDFDDGQKRMWITSSTDRVDSYRSIIVQSGIMLDGYKLNPIILENHDRKKPAIAKTVDYELSDKRTDLHIEFAPTAQGGMYYDLYKGGYMSAWSIGGDVPPGEYAHTMSSKAQLAKLARVPNGEKYLEALKEGKADIVFLRMAKNETSGVTLGANPGALSRAVDDGLCSMQVARAMFDDGLQALSRGVLLLQQEQMAAEIRQARALDADLTTEQRLAWHVLSRLRL